MQDGVDLLQRHRVVHPEAVQLVAALKADPEEEVGRILEVVQNLGDLLVQEGREHMHLERTG
jgi:hypothetical protein